MSNSGGNHVEFWGKTMLNYGGETMLKSGGKPCSCLEEIHVEFCVPGISDPR